MIDLELNTHLLAAAVVVAFLFWLPCVIIYRLYFHRLADFPGPRLAASTHLYEWYYDLWLGGQFTWRLKDLHKQYGPIIRVNPDELHIDDPEFYDQIFNNTNGRTDKPWRDANAFGPFAAAISTMEHDLHRVRRTALNPFFSHRSVTELIPCVRPVIEKFCDRLEDAAEKHLPVNLKYAYAALTTDVITECCFSKSANQVSEPDFAKQSLDDLDSFVEVSLFNVHIPWLFTPIFNLPDWVSSWISPAMANMLKFRQHLSRQVEDIRSGRNKNSSISDHKTIFHSLLQSKLPEHEKAPKRLRDEAFELVSAGSGTTAFMLKNTTYYIMNNPEVHVKLFEALNSVMPNRTDFPVLKDLENLPYLTAIINEGLRVSNPVTHRLSRSFPEKSLNYHGRAIPPDTPVMMTSLLMHQNEEIFPEHQKFDPERWLKSDQHNLQKYLTPFGRGSRACVGVTLFWAEAYIILATIFRRFEFDTSGVVKKRDIDATRDTLIAGTARDSPGMIVDVKRTAS